MNKLVLLVPAAFFLVLASGCISPEVADFGPKGNYSDDASPVMYFYSEGCHYCKLQQPILGSLATEGYRVKPMDIGANLGLVEQYELEGTPSFIAANGDRKVGLTQKDELRSWLLAHGAKIA